MKFAGIAAMFAVVSAVTGAPTPNVKGALDNVLSVEKGAEGLLSHVLGTENEAEVKKVQAQLKQVEDTLAQLTKDHKRDGDLVDVNVKRQELLDNLLDGLVKRDGLDSIVGEVLKRDGDLVDVDALLKRQELLSGLLGGVTGAVKRDGDLVDVDALLKRDDPISQLAGQLLPQLQAQKILPDVVSLDQLTNVLNVLNVNGLVGNVTQVLGSLLGGTPLKGLLGGVLKRDDPVSQLAGQLLPQLQAQNIIPQALNLDHLTGLLNVLNVNGLLTNVESVLGGLLGGLPLKGLLGGLL